MCRHTAAIRSDPRHPRDPDVDHPLRSGRTPRADGAVSRHSLRSFRIGPLTRSPVRERRDGALDVLQYDRARVVPARDRAGHHPNGLAPGARLTGSAIEESASGQRSRSYARREVERLRTISAQTIGSRDFDGSPRLQLSHRPPGPKVHGRMPLLEGVGLFRNALSVGRYFQNARTSVRQEALNYNRHVTSGNHLA